MHNFDVRAFLRCPLVAQSGHFAVESGHALEPVFMGAATAQCRLDFRSAATQRCRYASNVRFRCVKWISRERALMSAYDPIADIATALHMSA